MFITKEQIENLDKSNMIEYTVNLAKQITETQKLVKNQSLKNFPQFNNIILLGTGGGSSIASKLIKTILDKEIDLPIFINQGYSIPKWVNKKTLAVALTVSGNTEETIQAYEKALNQGAFGVAVTVGGKLKDVVDKYQTNAIYLPETNMQARSAIGYLFISLLHIFKELNILSKDYSKEIENTVTLLENLSKEYNNLENNLALKIANKLKGFTPVIYSSDELLEIASVRWKNQFGENSKVISHYYTFPELNHDEIVGWEQPENLQKHFKLILLRDSNDNVRIQKRIDITKELIEKRGVEVIEVHSKGISELEKVMSLIYLGDWVSIYLALLYKIDPTPVNLIIEMKEKLK